MGLPQKTGTLKQVALLAEGVGRNADPSASTLYALVALLAEGVGRNPYTKHYFRRQMRRPPRGGRG